MFKNSFNKISLLFAGAPIVKGETPFIGIQNFDLNTFMGMNIGWLKWPSLIGVVFAVIAFAIGAFYLARYNKGFYAGRTIPNSWKFILWGIFITAIAEIGEITVFYEVPNAGMFETAILTIIPHILGGILIASGSYLLYKEVTK
jgi:hypothetical protein